MFNPGDKVYYHVMGGWGRSFELRLIAVVEKTTAKMATITLWNERRNRKESKRVALTSLSVRETYHSDLD